MISYLETMKGKEHVNWAYFNKFDKLNDIYLPRHEQGETMATQICTVLNKLVYKWYNDGDVYDNSYKIEGWWNDLSSFANWLYKYVPQVQEILDRIETINHESEYEFLLKDLTDCLLNEKTMEYYSTINKLGSIYECNGKFKFVENYNENEDDEDEEM